jgi:hypothetical protein
MTAVAPFAARWLDNWQGSKETTAASLQASRNFNRANTKLFRSQPVQAKIYIARYCQEPESVEVESLLKNA